jgi:ACS family tartrate transporter-like MFS transporter
MAGRNSTYYDSILEWLRPVSSRLSLFITHWFGSKDRATVIGVFMSAIAVANIMGGPFSGAILGVHWFGIDGWRWIFIIEGLPAILLGIIGVNYLTDRPEEARWLTNEEREWIVDKLRQEKKISRNDSISDIVKVCGRPEILLLALFFFLVVSGYYGFTIWLPVILKKLSILSDLAVSSIIILPYLAGLIVILIAGWSSDRAIERRWHIAVPIFVAAVALMLSTFVLHRFNLVVFLFCIVTAGLHAYLPSFWAMASSYVTDVRRAAAIGFINSAGSLGGFLGTYAVGYLSTLTNSFVWGLLLLATAMPGAAVLILVVRAPEYKQS